jgi:hypothetical protein
MSVRDMYGRTHSGQGLPGFEQAGGFAPPKHRLRFDGRLVHQHDGDVVVHPIDAVTVGALQAFWILAIFERLLAGGTNQDVEEIFGKHDGSIVRRIRAFSPPRTPRASKKTASE